MTLTPLAKQALDHYKQTTQLPLFKRAAIVANLIGESNLNVHAHGDIHTGGADGIAQWHHDRLYRGEQWAKQRAKNWEDLSSQLDFVLYEMSATEKTAGWLLGKASNIEEAVTAMLFYERPAGFNPHHPRDNPQFYRRLALAKEVMALEPQS